MSSVVIAERYMLAMRKTVVMQVTEILQHEIPDTFYCLLCRQCMLRKHATNPSNHNMPITNVIYAECTLA